MLPTASINHPRVAPPARPRSEVAWQCQLWNSNPPYGHRLVTALGSQMRRVLHTLGPLVLIALAAYLGWALVMH